MFVYTKAVRSMAPIEYEDAYALNLGGSGLMRGQLRRCYEGRAQGRAILAYEGTTLVGWALKFRDPSCQRWSIYTFVHKGHRRKGIARKLVARARMGQPEPIEVYPCNDRNRAFYRPLVASGRATVASGYYL